MLSRLVMLMLSGLVLVLRTSTVCMQLLYGCFDASDNAKQLTVMLWYTSDKNAFQQSMSATTNV